MPEMGINSLKANLTNPARDFIWDVIVPVPIGNGDSTIYNIRAQSSEIPARTNTVIVVPYKNTPGVRVAGKPSYGDHTWACTFVEGEDKKVFNAIDSWQQVITNNELGVGVGDPLYKTDVYIALVAVAGQTYMKLKIKGAWISNRDKVALTYTEGGGTFIRYNVTFTFDSIEDVS